MVATVHIRSGRAQPFWSGHPWVFRGALAKIQGQAQTGDLVEVVDPRGVRIGAGLYHATSALAVRLVPGLEEGQTLDLAFFRDRLVRAKTLRTERLGLWRPDNDAYRLCNAEGDGIPALNIDVFNRVIVVQWGARAIFDRRVPLLDALQELYPQAAIVGQVNRDAAKMEGWTPEEVQHLCGPLRGELPPDTTFTEEGVRFHLPTARAQKTGHYLDQRRNRLRFAELARGELLDGHCYSGGFALQAARRGSQVTAVDSSREALALLTHNMALNHCTTVQPRQGQILRELQAMAEEGRRFDGIALDPPKLAPRQRDLDKALEHYGALVRDALPLLRPGGMLALSSCAQVIDAEALARVVAQRCGHVRRQAVLIEAAGAAPDHPVPAALREGRYLSFALFGID